MFLINKKISLTFSPIMDAAFFFQFCDVAEMATVHELI